MTSKISINYNNINSHPTAALHHQNPTFPHPTGPAVSSKIVISVSNHPCISQKNTLTPSNVSANINHVKSCLASGRLMLIRNPFSDHFKLGCGTGPSPRAAVTAATTWYCAWAMSSRKVWKWMGGPYLLKIREVVVEWTRIW